MHSFEADPDVAAMLELAVNEGATERQIINAALRKNGRALLLELAAEYSARAARLRKEISE